MAQNVIIAGVTYNEVPAIDLPKAGGGTARFVDETTISGGGSAPLTIKSVTVNPPQNMTSLEFPVDAQPKFFSVMIGQQISGTGNRYVVAIMHDGSRTMGVWRYHSGTFSSAYDYWSDSNYSFTYTNGKLIVKSKSVSEGGNFKGSTNYILTYGY